MAAQQTFAFFQTGDPVRKTSSQSEPLALATGSGQNTKTSDKAKPTQVGPVAVPGGSQIKPVARVSSSQIKAVARVSSSQIKPVARASSSQIKPVARATDTASILKRLRSQVGCVSTVSNGDTEKHSTGCQAIDDLLPNKGLRVDALTEWVATTTSGAGALALIAAANQLRHAPPLSPLVVIDTKGDFYPPAAIALGIPADRIVLVRTNRHADVVWAIDQALRCEAVGAVWANVGAWLDDRDARRFQLAAEMGKTPGLLVRPTAVRGRPSFADVRFHVDQVLPSVLEASHQIAPQQLAPASLVARVTIDRCRGGTTGQQLLVQVDDQARMKPLLPASPAAPLRTSQYDTVTPRTTVAVHLANQLAHPTPTKRVDKKRERRA